MSAKLRRTDVNKQPPQCVARSFQRLDQQQFGFKVGKKVLQLVIFILICHAANGAFLGLALQFPPA